MAEPLDRQMARFAYSRLAWIKLHNAKLFEQVHKRALGLPVQVRAQGLTTAVATLLSEGRPESKELADLIAQWVLERSPRPVLAARAAGGRGPHALLRASVDTERASYLAAQADGLALLEHVKRLAGALAEGDSDVAG